MAQTDKSVSQRYILTAATTISLLGGYWLYAQTVVPFLTPETQNLRFQQGHVAIQEHSGAVANVQMAEKHLAEIAPWAKDANLQFHHGDAYMYAQSWNRGEEKDIADGDAHVSAQDSDRADEKAIVRFQHFAMIWFSDSENAEEEPITMVAESARVQFAGTFDMANPEPGRPIGGELQRTVQIRGPDGLSIDGRNFIFDEAAMHVRSDSKVDFRFAGHYGSAEGGVELSLIPAKGPRGRGSLAVGGIRSVLLRRNVAMHLFLEGDDPAHVTVRCRDAFDYVLETNIARFRGNVTVQRPTSPTQMDSLSCDLLTLKFDTAGSNPKQGPAKQTDDSFQLLDGDLQFVRLRAEGKDVTVASPVNRLDARMADLTYDYQNRSVVMKDGRDVKLRQGNSQLDVPEITFALDKDDRITEAWCRGKGRLVYRDPKAGQTELTAEWLRELHKYSDQQTGLDVFELQGNAIVRHPESEMGIGAGKITLWADQLAPLVATSTENTPRRIGQGRAKQLRAEQDVEVLSPQLIGRTQLLDVWFEQRASSPRTPRPERPRPKPSPTHATVSHAAPSRKAEPATEPATDPAASQEDESEQPVEVSADWIRVRVVDTDEPDRPKVDTVWADGNVDVRQKDSEGRTPLQMTGSVLRLQNNGPLGQDVVVVGEPADVRNEDTYLAGQKIHFDRAANYVTISGAGLMRFLVTQDFEGNPLDQPQTLTVEWKDELTFNGEKATFLGDVSATLADSRMQHCEKMTVTLTRRISFADTKRDQRNVEIRKLTCESGVDFDSREYLAGELVAIRKAQFWGLTLNPITGDFHAEGPEGKGLLWRRSQHDRTALSPAAVAQANRPLESEESEWEYLRIDFSGTMDGNIQQKHTTFNDDVLIVYGPVDLPLDTIDPDELTKGAGWLRCEELQLTQRPTLSQRTQHVELHASGNTEMHGRSFHARSDVVSYDDSKKLFILRAIGNHEATIWHSEMHPSGTSAQRIEFSPSRNTLELDRTTGMQLR